MNEPSPGQISTSGANARKRVNPSSFAHAPREQGAGAPRNGRRLSGAGAWAPEPHASHHQHYLCLIQGRFLLYRRTLRRLIPFDD
jgi:hypothetical protein